MNELVRVLESTGAQQDGSAEGVLLAVLLAFVLGQALAWSYAWSHSGLSYSRSFTQSLVLMTIVVSLVMFVIGNSLITAFGLLGALALIRFRNVLKDTRDTVFVFIALVIGMAVGSQRHVPAVFGTAVLILVIAYLKYTSFGSLSRFDGYLTVQLVGPPNGSEPQQLMRRFCTSTRQVSSRQSGEEEAAELVFQIGLRDRRRVHELLSGLQSLENVSHASMVLRDELTEI